MSTGRHNSQLSLFDKNNTYVALSFTLMFVR